MFAEEMERGRQDRVCIGDNVSTGQRTGSSEGIWILSFRPVCLDALVDYIAKIVYA